MTIKYEDIDNKLGLVINRDYPFTSAQTDTNYGYIFTAPFPYEIISATVKYAVKESTSPVLLLHIMKVPDGTALASGVRVDNVGFKLTLTANTAQMKSATDFNDNRSFDPNDSIALDLDGTAHELSGLQVTIYVKAKNMGGFRDYGK